MEASLKILEAATSLIQVTIWPLVILFIISRFAKPLSLFFEDLSEFKVKAAGVEASATREQVKAAALLGAASSKSRSNMGTEQEVAEPSLNSEDIASAVADLAEKKSIHRKPARILWVDDRPSNNYFERGALEQLGIRFEIARSTDEALEKLKISQFDLIISDMGRPPDSRAGYTLLGKLRRSGNQIPFIIYAGSNSLQHKEEARNHGALGSTNRPDELFTLISDGLSK